MISLRILQRIRFGFATQSQKKQRTTTILAITSVGTGYCQNRYQESIFQLHIIIENVCFN